MITVTEMLSTEPKTVNKDVNDHQNPVATPELKSFQRQNCIPSARRINRPASVPSTKKFEDCGVSTYVSINDHSGSCVYNDYCNKK